MYVRGCRETGILTRFHRYPDDAKRFATLRTRSQAVFDSLVARSTETTETDPMVAMFALRIRPSIMTPNSDGEIWTDRNR